MDMDQIDLSPTEWLKEFIIFSKKELEFSNRPSPRGLESLNPIGNPEIIMHDDDDIDNDDIVVVDDGDDDNDDDDDDDDDDDYDDYDYDYDYKVTFGYSEEQNALCTCRINRMAPLFASQPRLKKICEDRFNKFLYTCFIRYVFTNTKNDSVDELHEKVGDLKYVMNLCGTNLKWVDVREYPSSEILPIINANCPNLEKLSIGFKEIMSQDFENVFSNMSHVSYLKITWQCKSSTLPMTLAQSLKQISGTLKQLDLSCALKRNDIFSPDSLALVFPRLFALENLEINGFGLSELLIQSIGKMKNLSNLRLASRWPKNHPMLDRRISLYSIGYLKNLEKLMIDCDYGIRDELLINLGKNAKKLRYLRIIGTSITDTGMSAVNNLPELVDFSLGMDWEGSKKNKYITDKSIQCLFNRKLMFFNISNCINITNKSAYKLVNLPNLSTLFVENTKVTDRAVEKIFEVTKLRLRPLTVYNRF